MIILQHQQDTITIDFPELTISATMTIEENDQSGDTSQEQSTPGGIKPWEFSINFIVPNEKIPDLKKIIQAIRKRSPDLSQAIWNIANPLINKIDVLQIKFTGQITIKKAETLHAQAISLTLKETNSVSERTETHHLAQDTTINNHPIATNQPITQQINKNLNLQPDNLIPI